MQTHSNAAAVPLRERTVRRVLMTADAVGGVWPYALDLSAGLASRGVSVTLAVMGPPPRPHQAADADGRRVPFVHQPFRLEWMEHPWEDVEAAGAWLLGLADSLEVDVVHLNGYCHASLPWRVPAVVAGHSCVRSWWSSVHGADAPPAWSAYSAAVTRGLGSASLVIAPSAAMLAALKHEYGPLPESWVIPNGCSMLEAGTGRRGTEDRALVLAAGRIWDEAKNIGALCAVASRLTWPVALAGDTGPPDGTSTGRNEDGSLCAGTVTYLGTLSRPELQEWYSRAGIYALPARYEPFGLSILEAAAAGCALVLGDISSLRENWTGAAVFVPPDDRRALASAIQSLIDDPAHRAELGRRAADRARCFTVTRMVSGYMKAYEHVLGRTAAAESGAGSRAMVRS